MQVVATQIKQTKSNIQNLYPQIYVNNLEDVLLAERHLHSSSYSVNSQECECHIDCPTVQERESLRKLLLSLKTSSSLSKNSL